MFTKDELVHVENIKRFLRRGKFELLGEEAIVLTNLLVWLDGLKTKINNDLLAQQKAAEVAEKTKELQKIKEEVEAKLEEASKS